MIRHRQISLRRDRRGATIIEFALVAPVMILTIMGLGELMFTVYAQSILDGAVQKAARDSAIEGGGDQDDAIDERVYQQMRNLLPHGEYDSERLNYHDFSSARPERMRDTNGNNIRDPGECFDDINGNGQWDRDPGRVNQGGASDVTRYRITVEYDRPFPVATLIGLNGRNTLVAETMLKNQPWQSQGQQVVTVICTP